MTQVRSGPDSRMPEGPRVMPSRVGSAWSLGCSERCHNERLNLQKNRKDLHVVSTLETVLWLQLWFVFYTEGKSRGFCHPSGPSFTIIQSSSPSPLVPSALVGCWLLSSYFSCPRLGLPLLTAPGSRVSIPQHPILSLYSRKVQMISLT